MNICPKCNKPYNIDYYKKRGCCSVCGFSFKADLHKEDSQEKYNAAIRKKAVEANKAQQNKRLVRCNATSLNNMKNTLQSTPDQKVPEIPSKPHKGNDKIVKKEDNEIPINNDADRLFTQEKSGASTTAPSGNNDEKKEEFTPDWNDAIFLNAEKIEISDDDSEESEINTPSNALSSDDDNSADDEYIDDDEIDDDDISDVSIGNDKNDSGLIYDLLHFKFIRRIIQKRNEKREEHFETDRKFNFNADGYYDDVMPAVEPEADIIPLKSILKVIGIIIGIFLFIAFIIYYA